MTDILRHLRDGLPIDEPVAVVVAHFDDETFSLGGSLHLFKNLTLIHVTDGGHADPLAWMRAGVASSRAYASMRRAEAEIAMVGVSLTAHHVYDVADRAVIHVLADVERWLTRDLASMSAVFTHPYEGGHPDHDALAYLLAGRPHYEFASYHLGETGRVVGQFVADDSVPEIQRVIENDVLARKAAACAAYHSQRGIAAWFDWTREAYRLAPGYDFSRLPTARCLYERKRFMRSAEWRLVAREHAA